MVEEYNGDPNKLGNVEKFVNTFLGKGLKKMEVRVKALIFTNNYKVELEMIDKSIQSFHKFFKLINNCQKLKKVITYTLAFGNYMNGQSNRGANFAFGIGDMLATTSIMSDNNSTSLLGYIIKKVENDHPELNYESN
jgi:hypothetical protein